MSKSTADILDGYWPKFSDNSGLLAFAIDTSARLFAEHCVNILQNVALILNGEACAAEEFIAGGNAAETETETRSTHEKGR